MSTTTSLVKQLMSEQSATNSLIDTDAASGGASYSDVRAAAKEGTTEALAEYHSKTDEAGVSTEENAGTETESGSGSSLKRGVILVLVGLYLLRRRRSSHQSTDTQ
jgi:hypothetical protein